MIARPRICPGPSIASIARIPCCPDGRSLSSQSHGAICLVRGTRHLQGPAPVYTAHTLWRLWTVWFTSKLLLISIPAPSQFAGHLHMLPAPASICPVTRNMEQWEVTTHTWIQNLHPRFVWLAKLLKTIISLLTQLKVETTHLNAFCCKRGL